MRKLTRLTAFVAAWASVAVSLPAGAQTAAGVPPSITTPDRVQTRIGTLDFKDGMPSKETVARVYDNLDLAHAVDAFLNTFQGASTYAIHQGFLAAGIQDNQIAIFPELMDAKSLFLTANADTVYFVGMLNLTKGPMVLETPPGALGTLDDMWWRWVIDFGAPGPDRGEGGKYLVLSPDYDGPMPEGGFYVVRARTTRVLILGRSFMDKDDPKPTVEVIKKACKIYPYEQGAVGTSIAEVLTGRSRIAKSTPPPPTTFVNVSGKAFNTIPPNDYGFWEMINALVQEEPGDALDRELMGQLAAVGIVKGKPFAPDARMKKILTEAAAIGNATSRSLLLDPRASEGFAYYPGSAWTNMMWVSGYDFETPPPMVTREGIKPHPPTGATTLNARSAFFYGVTGITPAMCMRIPGIGSQYLFATLDGQKKAFDGGKTYRVTLPPNIPQARFWSFTLYDNQTRSMLDTPQRYPRAGSQAYPSPAAEANADGSTTITFGPAQPSGVKRGNWIQTMPGKGWFTILRLYSPLESFFDKTWRPSEIELVR
jgi:hypothetical protein